MISVAADYQRRHLEAVSGHRRNSGLLFRISERPFRPEASFGLRRGNRPCSHLAGQCRHLRFLSRPLGIAGERRGRRLGDGVASLDIAAPRGLAPAGGRHPRARGRLGAGWSAHRVCQEVERVHAATPMERDSRELVTVPGVPFAPRFSPDGRRLRFTIRDTNQRTSSLWEVSADGKGSAPGAAGLEQAAGRVWRNLDAGWKILPF